MPATPAFCFAHARRKFFELADVAHNARRGKGAKPISPIALEAVKRIDALFTIERDINGLSAAERLAVRQEKSKPLLAEMEKWLRTERAGLSRSSPVAGPIDYMLSRWADFARYADDGRTCMTNNAAERALRGVACGRKAWLFAGSDRGADRAAIMLCQRRSKNRPRGGAKVGHCGAGLRPPGGLKPERGSRAGVAIFREVFSLPFGRGFGRDDSCRRSSRGC